MQTAVCAAWFTDSNTTSHIAESNLKRMVLCYNSPADLNINGFCGSGAELRLFANVFESFAFSRRIACDAHQLRSLGSGCTSPNTRAGFHRSA